MELPYDPAIPLLAHIWTKLQFKKIHAPLCSFTIAATWKQPQCPSIDDWIKKMWYIYTMEYYSAIKENKSAAIWMELEILIPHEVNQKEKSNTI